MFQSIGPGELIIILVWGGIIWATASVAKRRGRSPLLWGVLAFFLQIIALIIVAVLPAAEATGNDGE